MRTLLPLVRKEVRDARTHILCAAVLTVLVSAAVHHWMFGYREGALVAQVLVPLVGGLFVASLASDLVAAEVATKRIEPMAMLPVSGTRRWTAKALFLLIAGVGFVQFVALVQLLILWIAGSSAAATAFQNAMEGTAPQLAAVFALGAASFFFSTLLERGFAAVVAAIAVLGGIAFAVEWGAIQYVSDDTTSVLRLALPLVVGGAFVVASAFAFVRGGVHMGRKLRPALVGIAAALVLIVPAGAALAGWNASRGSEERQNGEDGRAVVSPDGKWVAITRGGDATGRVWIADVETGSVRRVADGFVELAPFNDPWTVESNLRVIESSFTLIRGARRLSFVTLEPSHLGIVEEMEKPWPDLGLVGRNASRVTIEGARVRLGWTQAVVYGLKDRQLLRRSTLFPSGTTAVTEGVTSFDESRDGRRLLVEGDGGSRALDASTGAVLFGPVSRSLAWVDRPVGRFVVEYDRDVSGAFLHSPRVRDLESDAEIELCESPDGSLMSVSAVLEDGRTVTRTDSGVFLHGADGKPLRQLFPAQVERR